MQKPSSQTQLNTMKTYHYKPSYFLPKATNALPELNDECLFSDEEAENGTPNDIHSRVDLGTDPETDESNHKKPADAVLDCSSCIRSFNGLCFPSEDVALEKVLLEMESHDRTDTHAQVPSSDWLRENATERTHDHESSVTMLRTKNRITPKTQDISEPAMVITEPSTETIQELCDPPSMTIDSLDGLVNQDDTDTFSSSDQNNPTMISVAPKFIPREVDAHTKKPSKCSFELFTETIQELGDPLSMTIDTVLLGGLVNQDDTDALSTFSSLDQNDSATQASRVQAPFYGKNQRELRICY